MGSPRRRVTSVDVAREAGLSRATVSYVLNDAPGQSIPEHTRQRVLAAARRLGYNPSGPARALRSGRSDVVVMVLPDWPQGPSMIDMVEAATDALAEAGLTLLTHHTAAAHPVPVAQLCATISPAAVAGVVPFTAEAVAQLRHTGVDVVFPSPESDSSQALSWLGSPGRLQAAYLIEHGHTRLGFALPDHPRLRDIASARLQQVTAACAEHDLQPPTARTVPLDPAAAGEAVAHWRAQAGAPTAICAYNDEVAMAVLAGMRTLGLAAPTDLAVVGADDSPMAKLTAPPLTTVAIDAHAHGRALAALLIARLAGEPFGETAGAGDRVVVRVSA
ncbi:LacI family DNA-binding transcriptional regulator [Nonomuraea sp. JJY05]|uniref:LacI family DNA-binding transcriptional regulator n=1 Tax=Nonomuraea sp. JJY05 TaxID=3350255 RepID=UPI00373E8509